MTKFVQKCPALIRKMLVNMSDVVTNISWTLQIKKNPVLGQTFLLQKKNISLEIIDYLSEMDLNMLNSLAENGC